MSTTHVVCFGNALHGDDGFGALVYRRLQQERLPLGSRVFDAGTAGLNALPYFDGCARAVLVDALRAGGDVGTVHRLAGSDLELPGGELSLHELGIAGLLAALHSVAREPPEIVVIGAEVGEIRPFTDRLSPPVETAVPEAVRLILSELALPRTSAGSPSRPAHPLPTGGSGPSWSSSPS